MNYRKLGKTNLNVSEIGLGTAQIGGPSYIGGELVGSPCIEKSEALNILNTAYEAGVNFFDSSDKYGDAFISKLSSQGDVLKTEQFPARHESDGKFLGFDKDNHLFFGGYGELEAKKGYSFLIKYK